MKTKIRKPVKVTRYDSLSRLLADTQERRNDACRESMTKGRGDSDFDRGTDNYDEAVTLTQRGWQEGATRVAALRSALQSAVAAIVEAHSQRVQFDVDGEWCDIGRLAEGDPECMGNWVSDSNDKSGRVIKIVCNVAVSWRVSVEQMFARGAACVAAVDILESLGHRCELWVAAGGEHWDDKRIDAQVCVKSAGQPVDTDRLSFSCCHAAMFRRLWFAHWEIEGFPPGMTKPAPVASDPGTVILPECCTGERPGKADMLKQVREICGLCGLDITEADMTALASLV